MSRLGAELRIVFSPGCVQLVQVAVRRLTVLMLTTVTSPKLGID